MQFNLADLFESLVDVIGERDALVTSRERLTFRELDERANRLAAFLRAQGVGPRAHVGLHLYNGVEFVVSLLATLKLRAVPINVNYRYVSHELRYLFENADLVALVTEAELLPMAQAAAVDLPALKTRLVVGQGRHTEEGFDFETAVASGSPARDFPERSGDDLYIIYTGGTTGMPKGVMWRQEDMFFAGLQGGAPGGDPITRPEELAENALAECFTMHMLTAAPFIHGAAQWGGFIGLFTGGKLVLQAGKSFDPDEIWRLIEREGVTTITLVGDAMARPLADALETGGYQPSSLAVIASAGAVLSPSVRDQLRALLPDTLVLNNFGATETGHQGSAIPGMETGREGRPTFFMDESNCVLDDDLRPAPPGVLGKLARGGRIPLGYYNDPEGTAARFTTIDGKRWVVPGDFALLDEEGTITVYGRGAVCINTGGEKVFPEEVEEALKAHADVFDALVVGLPDARWGERVAAVVAPRAGRDVTLEDLEAHCRNFVAGYKVPRSILVVPHIERQPSGKPDYKWARELALKNLGV